MDLRLRHLYEALGLELKWLASYSGISVRAIQERLKSNVPNEKLNELHNVLGFIIANGSLPEDCQVTFPDGFLERLQSLQRLFASPVVDICQRQNQELTDLRGQLETPPTVDLKQYIDEQLSIRDGKLADLTNMVVKHHEKLDGLEWSVGELEGALLPDDQGGDQDPPVNSGKVGSLSKSVKK